MKHTPRSRDVAKAAVSLGTGTATIAAFAATGALAGSFVSPATASPTPVASVDTLPTTDVTVTTDPSADQLLADQLAQKIQDRKTQLRKLDRLINRAKKAAKRRRIATSQTSTSTSTSSGSTTTKTTTTTTKPKSTPAPAPSSGS